MSEQPGDSIVYQDVWRGAVWSASPLTVVREADGLLPFLGDPSTPTRQVVWRTNRRLLLIQPGGESAVSLFWRDTDGRFLGWYIDLLAPIRRTAIGVASMDLILDIVISPDLSTWHWKDEDDFIEAGTRGLFSPDQVDRG